MKKKNFRTVPASIRARLGTFQSNVVDVCSIEKINGNNVTQYENLGIKFQNGEIIIPKEPLLPEIKNGKYSKYNVNGKVIIRRDLPKETRAMFYKVTDWHGDEHTGTYPRQVWQREIWQPERLKLSFELIKELPKETVVKISVENIIDKTSINFEHDLLFKINLLQESLGNCDVFEANCSEEEYIKTTYIDWQIFPPGEKDAREVFNSIPNTADRISFEEFEERDPSNYALTLLSNTVGYESLPINVFNIPEQEDYEVRFCNDVFDYDNQYGLSVIKSEDDKIIFLNSEFYGNSFDDVVLNDSKRRHCRFTLAHELGHCTIPEHKDLSLKKTLLNENNTHYRRYNFQREYEANVFAAELLIPSVAIKNIYSYGKNFKEIVDNLSNKFDTSVMASALRAASLMNDSICVCLQINKQSKKIINFKYSDAFRDYKKGLFIEKNSEPPSGTLSNSLIKSKTTCTYQIYNNPSDWFPNFYGSSEAKLHEWSFDMGENIITFLELIDTSEYNLYF